MPVKSSISRLAWLLILCSPSIFAVERISGKSLNLNSQFSGTSQKILAGQSVNLAQKVGLSDKNHFQIVSERQDARGTTHKKYQQTYLNIPIWGESFHTHNTTTNSTRASGYYIKDLDSSFITQALSDKKTLPKQTILDIAFNKNHHSKQDWDFENEKLKLVIFIEGDSSYLAYSVEYLAHPKAHLQSIPYQNVKIEPSRPNYIINALTGDILKSWEGLAHAEVGTGPGGNEKTGIYQYGSDFDHLDVLSENGMCTMENNNVKTVNLNHSTSGSTAYSYNCPENIFQAINGAYSPLNDAHFFGNVVFKMFQEWVGVPPLNFQLVMRVHYGSNFENAFWDGAAMTFGDGATLFYPLVDINVSAHEVSHGFTEQNSGLIYSNESGGINEAYSDISGEAAEYYLRGNVDWLVGADIMKSSPALRYFEDPTLDGSSIGHADDYFSGMNVHYSSGVFNRAYYLIANSAGWDPRMAFLAFTHANMNYWSPNSTFIDGACGVINAAHDLGYDFIAVDTAFKTVGVTCGSLPFIDIDEDGMDDNWENHYGLNPSDDSDAVGDLDEDGLNNLTEYTLGTNPNSIDSDNDSLEDYAEVNEHGTNPAKADTDDDTLPDDYELLYGFDPLNGSDALLDNDNDGFSNADEYQYGTDPTDASSVPAVTIISFEDGALPSNWQTPVGAHANWEISAIDYQHGSYSLKSSIITHSQKAGIEFNDEFAPGLMTFQAKTSSEANFDFLRVYLNDTQVLAVSGATNWQEYELEIAEGSHTIRFEYTKDGSINSGEDSVWIDSLHYARNDTDSDGMTNSWEERYGLDPNNASDAALDNDEDLLTNLEEFVNNTNPLLADTDNDGLSDYDEISTHSTDPNISDTDNDGLSDFDEIITHNTDATSSDSDSDGLQDGTEIELGTNPNNSDSDDDGMSDQWEVEVGLDPVSNDANSDPDEDGLSNVEEANLGTNPNSADSDDDGLNDYDETNSHNTNPLNPDTDSDGLPDGWEVQYELNANNPDANLDSDEDGYSNAEEYEYGTNPSDETSIPAIVIISFEDGLIPDSWQTPEGANASWEITTTDYQHGIYSLKSSIITHSQKAGIEFTDEFSSGVMTFQAKTSSEASYDFLRVYLNDTQLVAVSGTTNWQEYELNVSEGEHTIRFEYTKDVSVNRAEDSVWIDNLHFVRSDADNDGMTNSWEEQYGLDPNNASDAALDYDEDLLTNLQEFLHNTNPLLADTDNDGLSDFNEINTHNTDPRSNDSDGDGLQDGAEIELETNPNNSDSDSDGMSDQWEVDSGLNPSVNDANSDADEDGLPNIEELNLGTNPNNSDSDSDGMPDGWEVESGLNPTVNNANSDADEDGLSNIEELNLGTNPNNSDSDHDGMPDGWEVEFDLNPTTDDSNADTDEDGLSNIQELMFGTNPSSRDTDSDGIDDGIEISDRGTNPINSDSDNDGVDDGADKYPNNPNKHTDEESTFLGLGSINPLILAIVLLLLTGRRESIK